MFQAFDPFAQGARYSLLVITSGSGGEGKGVVTGLRRWFLDNNLDRSFGGGRRGLLQIWVQVSWLETFLGKA